MSKFGFTTRKDCVINMNDANLKLSSYLKREYPSYQLCISCGVCSAVCTAAQLWSFNIRELKLQIDRGATEAVKSSINQCMVCGKCEQTCPKSVSNRKIVLLVKQYLRDHNE
jgi:heterodisulfide reductase subunit C